MLDATPDLQAIDIAAMYADAELPGYGRDCVERDLAACLVALRNRERQRSFLNAALRPFGFTVRSLPNWRGEWLS